MYDNNSTDGTDEIAQQAGAIVRYEHRQGKGNVIRSMFRDIDADAYLMLDGDDTYSVDNAKQMIDLIINKGVDMVIGDRLSSTYFTENKRLFHNTGNLLVRKIINIFWAKHNNSIDDVMTGYRAFSPLFVKTFPVLSKGFEIETEMTIHALDKNLSVQALPVIYKDRPIGSFSKLNTYNDGAKVLLTIFKLYKDYNPLNFFSSASLFLFIASLCLFLPIFLNYLDTGLVPRMPTLIVAGFIAVMALQSLTCGFILDTIVKKGRQDFELKANMIKMLLNSNYEK